QKNIFQSRVIFTLCQRFPATMRKVIGQTNRAMLGKDYPMDPNFTPPYNPWEQRLCVVPDGDMFKDLRAGRASIVTGAIKTFTETGILLESGQELEADIIVTATGLNIQLFGGMTLAVDGAPVDLTKTVAYRGLMLSGLPNFAFVVGYTNSSWTLKVDMLCQYFIRILSYMDARGYTSVRPHTDPAMDTRPLLDFGAGYVQRALDTLPRQGTVDPWQMSMSVYADRKLIKRGPVDDEFLVYKQVVPARDAEVVSA
ncbi:MAG: NAD(P)/FAD-dependent oxidoreductase, partial [Gordonia sp. (in: high G+C Gram-positive bacteria)]